VIILLIMSAIFGAVISGVTGAGVLFWIAGGAVFICGLPFAVIFSFVHGEVSYAQDRADYRQFMSEIAAEESADEHECACAARPDRPVKPAKTQTNIYNDHRQVHFHGRPGCADGCRKGVY
jgi:hypothetical protein